MKDPTSGKKKKEQRCKKGLPRGDGKKKRQRGHITQENRSRSGAGKKRKEGGEEQGAQGVARPHLQWDQEKEEIRKKRGGGPCGQENQGKTRNGLQKDDAG